MAETTKPRTYVDEHGNRHVLSTTERLVVCGWRVRDPKRRSGWRDLRWKMSEPHAQEWAKANNAEVEPIDGSEEIRTETKGTPMPPAGGGVR